MPFSKQGSYAPGRDGLLAVTIVKMSMVIAFFDKPPCKALFTSDYTRSDCAQGSNAYS